MSRPNLKFVALHVPEIIGGTPTNSAVPGYAQALFSPKFSMGFVRVDTLNIPVKFEVRSFTEIIWGTQKMGRPCIRPRSLFS